MYENKPRETNYDKLLTMQSISRGITFSVILDENTNVPNTWMNEMFFYLKYGYILFASVDSKYSLEIWRPIYM